MHRARKEIDVSGSKYEVRAVIVLVLVGAFFLIGGNPADESHAELSMPAQIGAAR